MEIQYTKDKYIMGVDPFDNNEPENPEEFKKILFRLLIFFITVLVVLGITSCKSEETLKFEGKRTYKVDKRGIH